MSITAFAARDYRHTLKDYIGPDDRHSLWELGVTAVPFAFFWGAAWFCTWLAIPWLSVLMTIPASAFLVRLFMIQHDCGHGSFFSGRHANRWTGRIIGVLTMTPYDHWRSSHALHHAGCGNLERRGIGDVDTLTVTEYLNSSRWAQIKYRIYRHPVTLFVFGPSIQFLVLNRVPFGFMCRGWRPWLSTQSTNVAIVVLWGSLTAVLGWATFIQVHLPIMALAAAIGVWLFYIQHQFEHTLWRNEQTWDFHEAALYGSSYLDLPRPLAWLSANIGVHHVHHLASRIPFYRLQRVLDDHPSLAKTGRMTLKSGLRTHRLALWDEKSQRLVPFQNIRCRDGHR